MRFRHAIPLLLAWALFYDRGGRGAKPLDVVPTQKLCEQIRDGRIEGEVASEMGGALAGQTADNPLRIEAYRRAAARVRARYQCASVQ